MLVTSEYSSLKGTESYSSVLVWVTSLLWLTFHLGKLLQSFVGRCFDPRWCFWNFSLT